MSNVVLFPKARQKAPAEPESLVEAIWIAAILIQHWQRETEIIRRGWLVSVDAAGRPLADPYPKEPTVLWKGEDQPASVVIGLTEWLGEKRLPTPLAVFIKIWNADEPDDRIETFSEARDFLEAMVDLVRYEQDGPPRTAS